MQQSQSSFTPVDYRAKFHAIHKERQARFGRVTSPVAVVKAVIPPPPSQPQHPVYAECVAEIRDAEFAFRNFLPRWESLARSVCREFGVDLAQVRGNSRAHMFMPARFKCWYLLVSHGYGFSQIGRWFNRDHSSIMNGAGRYARENGLPWPRKVK